MSILFLNPPVWPHGYTILSVKETGLGVHLSHLIRDTGFWMGNCGKPRRNLSFCRNYAKFRLRHFAQFKTAHPLDFPVERDIVSRKASILIPSFKTSSMTRLAKETVDTWFKIHNIVPRQIGYRKAGGHKNEMYQQSDLHVACCCFCVQRFVRLC